MINVKKIKNLAFAVALGLVIGTQSVMPVNAATYSTCGLCGGRINAAITTRQWDETEQCTLREHYTLDCKVVTTKYQRVYIVVQKDAITVKIR